MPLLGTLRRSSSNESIDRKKPFSRPFSKSRIDGNSLPRSTRMSSPGPIESSSQLLRQNHELRSRLQEEQSNYRRRLETYKQAQQNQATLVSRLQSKVMQYKQRCNDLENQFPTPIAVPTPITCTPYIRSTKEPMSMQQPLPSPSPPMFGPPQSNGHATLTEAPMSLPCATYDQHHGPAQSTVLHHVHHDEYNDLSRRLDEERRRCEELMAQNTVLRQQLEESHRVNDSLTQDLQKLTNDWEGMRDDMVIKENEWKEEEQVKLKSNYPLDSRSIKPLLCPTGLQRLLQLGAQSSAANVAGRGGREASIQGHAEFDEDGHQQDALRHSGNEPGRGARVWLRFFVSEQGESPG